jgi:WD40 repeat protein
LALSSDGSTLAASGWGTVTWDTAAVRLSAVLCTAEDQGPNGPFSRMAFSPGDSLLIASGESVDIHLWDLARHEELDPLTSHLCNIGALAISPDGRTLASGDQSGVIKLWALEKHWGLRGSRHQVRELLTLPVHDAKVINLQFSPDGSLLASCGADGAVRLWRAE